MFLRRTPRAISPVFCGKPPGRRLSSWLIPRAAGPVSTGRALASSANRCPPTPPPLLGEYAEVWRLGGQRLLAASAHKSNDTVSGRGGPAVAARRPPQELVDSCGSSAAPPELVGSAFGELGGSAELGGFSCGSSAAPPAGARRLSAPELVDSGRDSSAPLHCCIDTGQRAAARPRALELETNEEGSSGCVISLPYHGSEP